MNDILASHGIDCVFLSEKYPSSLAETLGVLIEPDQILDAVNLLSKNLAIVKSEVPCLYSLEGVWILKSDGNERPLFPRYSIRSLDQWQWLPLNDDFQALLYNSISCQDGLRFLGGLAYLAALLCHCIYDLRGEVTLEAERRISALIKVVDFDALGCALWSTFYKFTPPLIGMLRAERPLSEMFVDYVRFRGY